MAPPRRPAELRSGGHGWGTETWGGILVWMLGIVYGMKAQRQVTVVVSEALLSRAQRSTGQGITPTIRRGLELVAAGRAYEAIRKLRGKVRFSIDVKSLREDR